MHSSLHCLPYCLCFLLGSGSNVALNTPCPAWWRRKDAGLGGRRSGWFSVFAPHQLSDPGQDKASVTSSFLPCQICDSTCPSHPTRFLGRSKEIRYLKRFCKPERIILDAGLNVQPSTECWWAAWSRSGLADSFQLWTSSDWSVVAAWSSPWRRTLRLCLAGLYGSVCWCWLLMSAMDKGVGEVTHVPCVCPFCSSPVIPKSGWSLDSSG